MPDKKEGQPNEVGENKIQSGPDIERLEPLDGNPEPDVTGEGHPHAERAPERDERGRL